MDRATKERLALAKKAFADSKGIVSISFGHKYKAGRNTRLEAICVGVEKKIPIHKIAPEQLIPATIQGMLTDVNECGEIKALSHVGKIRPCPGGFSIGHYLITAGTLGCYVKRGAGDDYLVLSNNHVLANSNDAQPNDEIRQPGNADSSSSDRRFALLEDYVKINFDGEDGGKKKVGRLAWKVWQAPANAIARLLGCPYRMTVSTRAIEQPSPNLVDCAVARPVVQGYVNTDIFEHIELAGIRDLELGDKVHKVGRTTEHTFGTVEGVNAMVKVSYGAGKTATFDNQLEIRSDSGEFSAGGDSGSAILTEDNYLGGLLFAGGSGVTIANRISDVASILGVRLF